jgi:hypothetical protein
VRDNQRKKEDERRRRERNDEFERQKEMLQKIQDGRRQMQEDQLKYLRERDKLDRQRQ